MKKYTITLNEIIEEEHEKLLAAKSKYGEVFIHTIAVYSLIDKFFNGYHGNGDIFLRFYTTNKNFYLLTLFSLVRLHHVQASLDLRQFIESGFNAAYAIAYNDVKHFAVVDEFGLLDPTDTLKKKRYKWFEENYTKISSDLYKIKEPVQFSTHSNVVDTERNINYDFRSTESTISTLFFDKDDDYHIKTGLWQLANTGLGILGLIYEVNRDYNALVLLDNFVEIHAELMKKNEEFKNMFMKTNRFKRADKIADEREKLRKSKSKA